MSRRAPGAASRSNRRRTGRSRHHANACIASADGGRCARGRLAPQAHRPRRRHRALLGGAWFGHNVSPVRRRPRARCQAARKRCSSARGRASTPSACSTRTCIVLGNGSHGSGCYLNKNITTVTNPWEYLKFSIYETAAGIIQTSRCDLQYMDVLTGYFAQQAPHGRALLFAFDQVHGDDGKARPEESEFYTPNEYVCRPRQASSPSTSAVRLGAPVSARRGRGAREGRRGRARGGEVAAERDEHRPGVRALRRVLRRDGAAQGAAHHATPAKRRRCTPKSGSASATRSSCAARSSAGHASSPTAPPRSEPRPRRRRGRAVGRQLRPLQRLMGEPQWLGRLWGDASAITIVNRVGRPLREALERPRAGDRA